MHAIHPRRQFRQNRTSMSNNEFTAHVYGNGMSPHLRSTQAITTPHGIRDRLENGLKDIHLHPLQRRSTRASRDPAGPGNVCTQSTQAAISPHEMEHSISTSTVHVQHEFKKSTSVSTTTDVITATFQAIDHANGRHEGSTRAVVPPQQDPPQQSDFKAQTR